MLCLLVGVGCGGGGGRDGETPPRASSPAEEAGAAGGTSDAESTEGAAEDSAADVPYDPVPHEGFFPPDPLNNEWMTERGIAIDADVVRRSAYRVAKLVIDDGEQRAPAVDLTQMERRYCTDDAVKIWNEDRCLALSRRACEGDTCTYQHFGNCSGLLMGDGRVLTAAHCVDGMVDHPPRKAGTIVLVPGPFGTPDRVPVGDIVVGKEDFDHHWVARGEANPVDVATVEIADHVAPTLEVADTLPATGDPVFIIGYPRVERRPAADRKRSGYGLNFGTSATSFGTLLDPNAADRPLCNVDGRQEHWALADPCPEGEVEVDGEATWKGVITRSVALADFDSCNGYSGAPVFDARGRLVGINVTLISKVDPQDRFDPDTRQVFVPARAALKRLGVAVR